MMAKSSKKKPTNSSLRAAKNRFLYALEQHGGRYTHAAILAEISLSDHGKWLGTDLEYRENYAAAIREGERRLTQVCYCMISEGARDGDESSKQCVLENIGEEALARILNGETPQAV